MKVHVILLPDLEKGAVSLLIPNCVTRGLQAGVAPLGMARLFRMWQGLGGGGGDSRCWTHCWVNDRHRAEDRREGLPHEALSSDPGGILESEKSEQIKAFTTFHFPRIGAAGLHDRERSKSKPIVVNRTLQQKCSPRQPQLPARRHPVPVTQLRWRDIIWVQRTPQAMRECHYVPGVVVSALGALTQSIFTVTLRGKNHDLPHGTDAETEA